MLLLHSFKLRNTEGPCKLVGPSFKQAKRHSFVIDGTQVTLSFPRHKTNSPTSPITPKKQYTSKGKYFDDLINVKRGWGALVTALNMWNFYGPIFSGRLANISMSVAILTPREPKTETSFFHPRSFEHIVGEMLTFMYGDKFLHAKQKWLAPSNWEPLERFPTVSAKYDILPSVAVNEGVHELIMPISDRHLLSIEFIINWNDPVHGNKIDTSTGHDLTALYELTDSIMDSVQVTLSEEAKAQQANALKDLKDTSLIKDYPPLKWEKNGVSIVQQKQK